MDKLYPETLFYGERISSSGHQPVYKKLLPDGEPVELSPEPSQKLRLHSPDGFQWGSPTSGRIGREIGESPLRGKVSYKSSGNFDDAIVGHWNFVEVKDVMIENADVDDVKGHSKFSSESYLTWDVSTEFNGSIHQYSFAIKRSDKITEKLIAISSEVSNFSKPLSRQMLISGNYFGKSTSLFTILNILKVASCSPHFPLKTEPFLMAPKVFILSPSIVTSLATKDILVGATCFAIDSIGQFFNNPSATKKAFNTLWHIILLTFYLNYITYIPNKTSDDGNAQLALALLLDATSKPEKALSYYQQFKWDKVASWGQDWRITRTEIGLWLALEEGREALSRLSKN